MRVGRCIHNFGEGGMEDRDTLVLNLVVHLPQTSLMLHETTVVPVTSSILFKKEGGGVGGLQGNIGCASDKLCDCISRCSVSGIHLTHKNMSKCRTGAAAIQPKVCFTGKWSQLKPLQRLGALLRSHWVHGPRRNVTAS